MAPEVAVVPALFELGEPPEAAEFGGGVGAARGLVLLEAGEGGKKGEGGDIHLPEGGGDVVVVEEFIVVGRRGDRGMDFAPAEVRGGKEVRGGGVCGGERREGGSAAG